MEDVFYFTKSEIRLEDIGAVATATGFFIDHRERPSGLELVVSTSEKLHSTWWSFGSEYSPFDPLPNARIKTYQPVSSFMVTYSLTDTLDVAMLLEQVLMAYGGWIGLDDDMITIFDSSNIYDLTAASLNF